MSFGTSQEESPVMHAVGFRTYSAFAFLQYPEMQNTVSIKAICEQVIPIIFPFLFFFSELFWGNIMLGCTKPQGSKKERKVNTRGR